MGLKLVESDVLVNTKLWPISKLNFYMTKGMIMPNDWKSKESIPLMIILCDYFVLRERMSY